MLEVKNLYVAFEGKEILKGLNLTLQPGKVHALMGPNGSGKTTLSYVLMGHPKYTITKGNILLNGKDITSLTADAKAKLGIFLSFQNPIEIEGVKLSTFLRQAYNETHEKKLSILEFNELLETKASELKIPKEFLSRYLNKGFSGGEKKKAEILQLLVLNPKIAILDETDSGLDIDSLKLVSNGINKFMNIDKDKIVMIITHYKRILQHVKPERVSIIIDGKVVLDGSGELVEHLEEKGYEWIGKK
jgi:Fe-S cluster assembly ATP-binding protein